MRKYNVISLGFASFEFLFLTFAISIFQLRRINQIGNFLLIFMGVLNEFVNDSHIVVAKVLLTFRFFIRILDFVGVKSYLLFIIISQMHILCRKLVLSLIKFSVQCNNVSAGLRWIQSLERLPRLWFFYILILTGTFTENLYLKFLFHGTNFFFKPISTEAPLKLFASRIWIHFGINIFEVFKIDFLGGNIFHFEFQLFMFIFGWMIGFLVLFQVGQNFVGNMIRFRFLI